MNVTDPIRRQAHLQPESLAVIRPDGVGVSYRDFDRSIDVVAKRAAELGMGPGMTAGISISGPYRFLVLSLALARLGVASAPASLPAERMDLCFTDAGTKEKSGIRNVTLEGAWAQTPAPAIDVPTISSHQDGGALFRIFSTSGTTGTPKYIALTHDLIVRRIVTRWLAARPPDNPRTICEIGLGASYSFVSLLPILWFGGLLVLPMRPTTSEQLVALIERYRVNHLVIAPASLASLIASLPPGIGPLPSLEVIEVSGSSLPDRLYEMARKRICTNILSLYGATEAASIASAPMAALRVHPGAVGYVHPGVEVQVVDEDDVPLPPGTEGILRVRSENCVEQYFGDATGSASVFKGGWFYPGDVGSVSREGLLSVAGRTNELINHGGLKVNPHVIEDVLLSFEGIGEAAAFGAPDAMGITQIWAAIVPKKPVDSAAVFAHCSERLAESTPRFIIQMKSLPRNDAGKILRNELSKTAASADPDKIVAV